MSGEAAILWYTHKANGMPPASDDINVEEGGKDHQWEIRRVQLRSYDQVANRADRGQVS